MKMVASEANVRFVQDDLQDREYTIEAWQGYEEFNRVSEHVVVIKCRDSDLKLEDFFLKTASLEIDCYKDKDAMETRTIKGVIRKVTVDMDEANQFLYTFFVVPQLWKLSQTENTRIFQEMSSKQIVQKIVGDYGLSMEMSLSSAPRTREYCVQYQESDLNFISRLAEDDGFYFFFKQDEDKVIFINKPTSLKDAAPLKEFAWDPGEGLVQQMPETIRAFEGRQQPRWKQVLVKDYNFRTPETDLLKQDQKDAGLGSSYQFITGHTNGSEGETLARVRLEEHRAGMDVITIDSSVRSAAVGTKFKLIDLPMASYNDTSYQIIKVNHHFQTRNYRNTFSCIALDTPYRPPRLTPRPRIQGLQTALVVGPAGFQAQGNSAQDLYVDEMGRIKVLFHWDLDQSRKENSSCWVRLMREYAGPGYGIFFLPRVGNEVLVSFLEGDPDRPIVVGSVHHANNEPPIQEPANKTQNTLLMPSTNELRFEDKEGSEQIYLHAQKDHIRAVENNETITVGNDRSKTVGNNETTHVEVNRTETVGGDETITIDGDRTRTVHGKETITIDGKLSTTVKRTESRLVYLTRSTKVGLSNSLYVGGSNSTTVIASNSLKVGGKCSTMVGLSWSRTTYGSEKLEVKGKRNETIGKARTVVVKTGNNSVKVKSGDSFLKVSGNHNETVTKNYDVKVTKDYKAIAKKVTIQGNDQVTIKSGSAKMVLKKNGDIEISGNKVKIKGQQIAIEGMQKVVVKAMNVETNGSVGNKMKGAMTTVEASGITTIKGSLVKIN